MEKFGERSWEVLGEKLGSWGEKLGSWGEKLGSWGRSWEGRETRKLGWEVRRRS